MSSFIHGNIYWAFDISDMSIEAHCSGEDLFIWCYVIDCYVNYWNPFYPLSCILSIYLCFFLCFLLTFFISSFFSYVLSFFVSWFLSLFLSFFLSFFLSSFVCLFVCLFVLPSLSAFPPLLYLFFCRLPLSSILHLHQVFGCLGERTPVRGCETECQSVIPSSCGY